MYRPTVPSTSSSPSVGNNNSEPVWGVVRPTPAMDNLQQRQHQNHHGEDSTALDLVEAQRRAARLYTRSNTAFLCSSIFNVLAIAFFTGGVFAAQLSFLVQEEDSSSGDVIIDEVDVYFYHAVATYGTVVITSDLPDCLSGLYIGGFVAGLAGVILCLLAMAVGVLLRYKNILTAARFVRPMVLCLSCCCAVVSAAISRAGTNTCNGDLEGYDMGTGIKLLFCTVVLVAVATVITLVRECKCPVLPDSSTTNASTLLLGQDMQQIHTAAAPPPSPHHQQHFPPPLLLPQQQQTNQQHHRTAGTSSSSYQQQHRQHQTPTSSPTQRPAQPPPFQLQGDDDDEPAQYTPALSPSSPPYESNDEGVYDHNSL